MYGEGATRNVIYYLLFHFARIFIYFDFIFFPTIHLFLVCLSIIHLSLIFFLLFLLPIFTFLVWCVYMYVCALYCSWKICFKLAMCFCFLFINLFIVPRALLTQLMGFAICIFKVKLQKNISKSASKMFSPISSLGKFIVRDRDEFTSDLQVESQKTLPHR